MGLDGFRAIRACWYQPILDQMKDYLDDSRRMLNWFIYNGDGEVVSYWNYPVWNDYDFIALLYTPLIGDPSIPERKIEGEIEENPSSICNEYISRIDFVCQNKTYFQYPTLS